MLKYTKGTQERGFILGAVDEIIQALDDNTMSLQSMSASRFVGPFLNTVQSWEKSLSLISEVIDVSACLQFLACFKFLVQSLGIFSSKDLDYRATQVDILGRYICRW